jgi:hypothetical protein
MKRSSIFFIACCFSWASLAQQGHDTPETRTGQMSIEVVAQLLREHGFSDVANLRLDGAVYRAEATKGGARVDIERDPLSGRLLKP